MRCFTVLVAILKNCKLLNPLNFSFFFLFFLLFISDLTGASCLDSWQFSYISFVRNPSQTTNFVAKEAKKVLERDWSSLPPELLNLIAKNLREISDFVRFSAVCTAWRSSTPITDLPPQFPWILEKRRNPYQSDPCFNSIPLGKIYTIYAPKSCGKWFCRPSDGYIVAKSHHLSLLNLLNNHEVVLPAYAFGSFSYWIRPWQNQVGLHMLSYGNTGCLLPMLVSFHLGQDSWSELKLRSDYINCNLFYLNNMLYIVERRTGVAKVKDIMTGTLAYVIPPIEGCSEEGTDFIIDVSGDILRIIRYRYWYSDLLFYERFDVYQLDVNKTGSPCWVKVNSIGNQALFIDSSYGCFALGASDFAGIRRNSIYSMSMYQGTGQELLYTVKKIDIETGAREHIPCPFEEADRWFVPSLQRL